MAKQSEHGRLIAAAAKAALEPLGCKRKGQSRLWYSDQRFWLIAVEFQPSSWSKGSYLNIGVKWLWRTEPVTSLVYRPVDFIPFENVAQFSPLIEGMAERAAQEVVTLRDRFKSLERIHEYLVAHATRDGWPIYDAAVAAGLIGDMETSRKLFQRLEEWPTFGYEWQVKLKSESAKLAAKLYDPVEFRSAVLAIITRRRMTMQLPPDPTCLEITDSTAGREPYR
jgi:hypothetical protein